MKYKEYETREMFEDDIEKSLNIDTNVLFTKILTEINNDYWYFYSLWLEAKFTSHNSDYLQALRDIRQNRTSDNRKRCVQLSPRSK